MIGKEGGGCWSSHGCIQSQMWDECKKFPEVEPPWGQSQPDVIVHYSKNLTESNNPPEEDTVAPFQPKCLPMKIKVG